MNARWRTGGWLLLWLGLWSVAACEEDAEGMLVVDLRTDFVLGPELHSLELYDLRGPQGVFVRIEPRGDDPLDGVRVAELEGLEPGTYHLGVVAWRPDGRSLARTELITTVEGATPVRILLTRDCAGVRCPASDPVLSACLGGACEHPECVGGDRSACARTGECGNAADCPEASLACGAFECMDGWCVVDTRASDCGGGGLFCTPEVGCVAPVGSVDGGVGGDGGAGRDGGVDAAGDAGLTDGGAADAGDPSAGSSVVAPACRDGIQNGDETGVDCGGSCTACAADICPVQSAIPEAECLALVALYDATGGDTWRGPSGWRTATSPCTWGGVTCTDGAVTGLDLYGSNLKGSLPPELGNLTRLEGLALSNNVLSGAIPPELGGLNALRSLLLDQNVLSGSIPPALGALGTLETLQLEVNFLTGSIPAELGALTQLRTLRLYDNALSGPLPTELGNLSSLEEMMLYGNVLSGSIPPAFGGLTNLRTLSLYDNALGGPIPSELGNLTNLEVLRLEANGLEGTIPATLGGLGSLGSLWLSDNGLIGDVPTELLDLEDTLTSLHLHDNACLTSSSGRLTSFLESLDPNWNRSNGDVACP